MRTLSRTAPAGSAQRSVSAAARQVAARLSALFDADVRIVARQNDAQRRLVRANDRLWCGLSPDAFGLMYDGAAPAGTSQLARLIDAALPAGGAGSKTAVLTALQDAHWAIHRGFCEYQSACEERRQLAVEVGELAQRLTEALCAAGWTAADARNADVHQLAQAAQPTTSHQQPAR
jgi:hypothetical protein